MASKYRTGEKERSRPEDIANSTGSTRNRSRTARNPCARQGSAWPLEPAEEMHKSPERSVGRREYPRREPENGDRSAYVPSDAAARINLQRCADAGKKVK